MIREIKTYELVCDECEMAVRLDIRTGVLRVRDMPAGWVTYEGDDENAAYATCPDCRRKLGYV